MTDAAISMLVAFGGYSLLNVSQACQKIALGVTRRRRVLGTVFWLLATGGTTGSSFVLLYAVSTGNVSIVGAMAGTGLASLTLFSAFVMRERVRFRELAGVGVVLAAAVLIGITGKESDAEVMRIRAMYTVLGALVAAGAGAVTLLGVLKRPTGPAIGLLSGLLGGFIPKFQKVSTSDMGKASSLMRTGQGVGAHSGLLRGAGALFTNPYALTWILLSVLSMAVLQFAFKRGKAIQIIPLFTGAIIVVPVLGGVAFFGETLTGYQIAGVGLILVGVMLMIARTGRENP